MNTEDDLIVCPACRGFHGDHQNLRDCSHCYDTGFVDGVDAETILERLVTRGYLPDVVLDPERTWWSMNHNLPFDRSQMYNTPHRANPIVVEAMAQLGRKTIEVVYHVLRETYLQGDGDHVVWGSPGTFDFLQPWLPPAKLQPTVYQDLLALGVAWWDRGVHVANPKMKTMGKKFAIVQPFTDEHPA